VISQVEDQKKNYLPKMIKNLAKQYIAEENSLILLACSLEGDIENTQTLALLQKTDIAGKQAWTRALGVMTKPDRVARGQPNGKLFSMLSGQAFQLGHSYFVTRQPDQVELDRGITHGEARVKEMEYFNSKEPWAATFSAFQDRFGTSNLVQTLSAKLAAMALEK